MKRVSIFTVLFLAVAVAQVWATPACPTTSTTLAAYEALGTTGCQIGDKIFSNFTYVGSAGGSGGIVSAGAIEVDTLGPTSGPDPAETLSTNIGLTFSAGWAANSTCPTPTTCTGSFEDSEIGFTVTVINGSNMMIEDAAVAQTSSGANGAGSSASVTEGGCGPAPCTPGTWSVLTFVTPGNSTDSANGTIFAPTGSVQVLKDIDVTAGAVVGGFAALSSVNDTFSQVDSAPEPATLLLVGAALCGIAVIRRRSVKA